MQLKSEMHTAAYSRPTRGVIDGYGLYHSHLVPLRRCIRYSTSTTLVKGMTVSYHFSALESYLTAGNRY